MTKKKRKVEPPVDPNAPDPEALAAMRAKMKPGRRWAAYQNVAMDSRNLGLMIFLPFDEGEEVLPRAPDGAWGMGWRYPFKGWVNLDTGKVEEAKKGEKEGC